MVKSCIDIEDICKRCPCLSRCVKKAFMPCKNGKPVIRSLYSLKKVEVVG